VTIEQELQYALTPEISLQNTLRPVEDALRKSRPSYAARFRVPAVPREDASGDSVGNNRNLIDATTLRSKTHNSASGGKAGQEPTVT